MVLAGCGQARTSVDADSGEVVVKDVQPDSPAANRPVVRGLEEAIRKAIQENVASEGSGRSRDGDDAVEESQAARPSEESSDAGTPSAEDSGSAPGPIRGGAASPAEALAGAVILQRRSDQELQGGNLRKAYAVLNEALDLLEGFPDDDACRNRAESVIEAIRGVEDRLAASGRGVGGVTDRPLIDP